ncbi:MAG: phage baseplate assembly protein V [Proteobacteria bacterium]|nr:phage baseplate assembly protein V [Pseudomonadota bacterium]
MNNLPSRWPGVVVSYDGPTRTCKVSIPGITDGSSELPVAVFENPLGDRAGETEIRIVAGDTVWLSFECGDPRYPIITGFRTPREGNPVNWRRYRHANIELTADGQMILNASELIINAQTTVNGDVATVGALTNNGQNVGDTHYHDEQGDLSPTSTAKG